MAQLLEPDLVQRNTAPAKKARRPAQPNKGTRARPTLRGAGILQGVVTTRRAFDGLAQMPKVLRDFESGLAQRLRRST